MMETSSYNIRYLEFVALNDPVLIMRFLLNPYRNNFSGMNPDDFSESFARVAEDCLTGDMRRLLKLRLVADILLAGNEMVSRNGLFHG